MCLQCKVLLDELCSHTPRNGCEKYYVETTETLDGRLWDIFQVAVKLGVIDYKLWFS
jgi:hypothetical protein